MNSIIGNTGRLALSIGVVMLTSTSASAYEASRLSSEWLTQQINKHPDIISANENMNAVFSSVKDAKLPLYNPELASEFERGGANNKFTVGVNQTVDWWDKRSLNTRQADFRAIKATKQFEYLVQQKLAQALSALIMWQSTTHKAQLAFAQERQLDTLLEIVSKRQKAGDLGQVDVQLAYLNQSQLLNESAKVQAQLKQATATLNELLPDWTPSMAMLSADGFGISNTALSDEQIEQHPLIAQARAQWKVEQTQANQASLAAKADPTFGVNVGKNAGDNVIGLSFSMPLNVRNNYDDRVAMFRQQANAAQANYHAVFRQQKFQIKANTDILHSNKRYLARWQQLMNGRAETSANVLQKQWEIGDFNTADYLMALQQRTQGLYAGIELKTTFRISEVEWLLSAGKIDQALKLL